MGWTPYAYVTPAQIAEDMKENGRLDEASISDALGRGDVDLVIAGIAAMAEMPMPVVEKAMDSGSAPSVIAVCWKAGLSAALATEVQESVAGIKGDDIIAEKGNNYASSDEAMKESIVALEKTD